MSQNILVQGNNLAALLTQTVGTSPFSYTNPYQVPAMIILDKTAGVTNIAIKRGGTTTNVVANTINSISLILGVGDTVIITWATTTPLLYVSSFI
jgi:hypothetical protein